MLAYIVVVIASASFFAYIMNACEQAIERKRVSDNAGVEERESERRKSMAPGGADGEPTDKSSDESPTDKLTEKVVEGTGAAGSRAGDDWKLKHLKRLHPFSYSALSGIFGGHSALFAKSTVEMLSSTFDGDNQLGNVWFWVFLICMFVCVISQTHFLAKGLMFFDSLYIIPIFQCFFITTTICGGAIYFQELSEFTFIQWAVFLSAVGSVY
jgi:hypothetical protein